MTAVSVVQVRAAAKGRVDESNLNSIMMALSKYGPGVGLNLPHRAVQFLCQLMHESGSFRYDREIWGPTPAQERYDTRTDLGNTPEKDGDGYKNRGRGPIQVTGAHNIRTFYQWCKRKGFNPPDFVKNPDLINTDPWEGLSAIWYWDEGNPDGKSLNRYADRNDPEMITRRINGGLNGFADRLDYYTRLGLAVLGFKVTDIIGLQNAGQKAGYYKAKLDGLDGPQTRAAIHLMLVDLSPKSEIVQVKAAPVVEEKPVPVTPPSLDAPWWKSKEVIVPVVTGGGLSSGLATVGSMPWQNLALILLAFGLAGAFLLWRKKSDAKAVSEQVQGMA
ncbi:chitinase [Agrobacterium sp. TS43]|uniref:glycoside hydrolase family 19 protein n=1 Tax=Agrobacterium TaxID=357 RepID=UPI00049F7844|nr:MULTISPECIES: glycoside hydrolase family 19 protein [Agrobacterium]KDR87719.1 chitinase [Agrobacterium tumefaciens GW4]KVK49515.1 chitinase [Agrobacterium sp. JL28]KVK49752.1 chitinase [Agrobacterium sp. LY4]KVK62693.1 chitinase [Agrobacterium sp. TS45]KVK65078.1 chitinase [Agrobacterium sp. TS43]